MVIGDIHDHPIQSADTSEPRLAVMDLWVGIGECIDMPVHGQSGSEFIAGARPASAFEKIGEQVSVLVGDGGFGEEDVGQPVHEQRIVKAGLVKRYAKQGLNRHRGGGGPVVDPDLRVDLLQMFVHGAWAEREDLTDLLVCLSMGDP